MTALEPLGVFTALTVLDFVWARYTYAMTNKKTLRAGGYAAMIIGLGGFATISYTSNHWLLLPAAAGAFCGTVLAVYLERRTNQLPEGEPAA